MEQQQPQIQVDPNLAAEEQQAQQLQTQQLQIQTQGDTAALMAQYGTRLAVSGGSPAAPVSVAPSAQSAGGGFLYRVSSQAPSLFAGKI
jgi:hypothetical protein